MKIKTNNSEFKRNDKAIAFIYGTWHSDIVLNCLKGFKDALVNSGYNYEKIDVYPVAGAYEIPLQAKLLAKSGKYHAIAASGLVVDGGIYRHDFVAQAVCSGLMQVQLEAQVPVLTAVLTPHNFHEHDEHKAYFSRHFVIKGTELANALDATLCLTQQTKNL
jgi:6,7-dimethyl-8-ribityllumazine synthase